VDTLHDPAAAPGVIERLAVDGFAVLREVLHSGQVTATLDECERLEQLYRDGAVASDADFNVEATGGGFHAQHADAGEAVGAYDRLRKVMHVQRHSPVLAELATQPRVTQAPRLVYADPQMVLSVLWFKPTRRAAA